MRGPIVTMFGKCTQNSLVIVNGHPTKPDQSMSRKRVEEEKLLLQLTSFSSV